MTQKAEMAQTFLTALRTRPELGPHPLDRCGCRRLEHARPSTISGEASGIEAILRRAATIASHGMRFTVERVLAGLHGVASSLQNTAEDEGRVFDMHLATILTLGEDKVTGIATWNIEKLNAFFRRE